jgi:hypothetical protein
MDGWYWVVVAGAVVVGGVIGFLAGRGAAGSAKLPADARPPLPEAPKKPSGAPLRLLALLQREGRLVDFLLEDITAYDDAQVGAAVRDIHRGCRQALQEHLTLDRILPGEEESQVTVPAGFDPSAVRLTGNVTGQPPFRGTLRHHGWRVKELKLANPPAGQDEFVVAPAEVHLS